MCGMAQSRSSLAWMRFDDLSCRHKATIAASGDLACGGQQLGLAQYQQLCAPGSKAPPLSCIYVECLDMCLKVGQTACLWLAAVLLPLLVRVLPGPTGHACCGWLCCRGLSKHHLVVRVACCSTVCCGAPHWLGSRWRVL